MTCEKDACSIDLSIDCRSNLATICSNLAPLPVHIVTIVCRKMADSRGSPPRYGSRKEGASMSLPSDRGTS